MESDRTLGFTLSLTSYNDRILKRNNYIFSPENLFQLKYERALRGILILHNRHLRPYRHYK